MSGGEKAYVIWFDRNGKFERVVIYDENFCYDSAKVAGFSKETFSKTSVSVTDVYERDTETTLTYGIDTLQIVPGESFLPDKILGCQGSIKAQN